MKCWLWSLVSQFWNPFLSSKPRLEEEIPHFCKVLNIQGLKYLPYMSTACVNVRGSEYPALWGMWKCFWAESSCFYLQHIVLELPPLTYSVFTVPARTRHLTRHVRNSCQSSSIAVSQTETKCDWIREQTPESWKMSMFSHPMWLTYRCNRNTHLLVRGTLRTSTENSSSLPGRFFFICQVWRCDKMIDPNHGELRCPACEAPKSHLSRFL